MIILFFCEDNKWSLSPLYDNSSSLCAYLSESKLESYLGRDMRLWNSLIDTKSKSLIRIRESDTKVPTHLDVMKYISYEYYNPAYSLVTRIKYNITEDKIDSLLIDYSDIDLPDIKKKIIRRFLISKIKLLTELFDRKEE